jgi:hypothetical protein
MPSPGHPAQLVMGLALWGLWFVVLYGGLSVGCALAPPDPARGPLTGVNGALALMTLATVGLLVYWAYRCRRFVAEARENGERAGFIAPVAAGAHLVAAAATFAIALPVLVLPPCL